MTAAIHGWAEPCGCTRTRTTAMSGLAAVDRKLEGGASAGLLPSLGKETWDVSGLC